MRYILASLALIASAYLLWYVVASASDMTDDFNSYSNNQLITNATSTGYYTFGTFPNAGTSGASNPSTKWEMDTGEFRARTDSGGNVWGHLPSWDLFRLYTRNTAQEATIQWRYKVSAAVTAVDVWARLQSQYWLYAVQFDRSDDCIVVKRKVPTNTSASGEWGGVAAGRGGEIANKGVYYVLRIDSDSPGHGSPCNQDGVKWSELTMGTSSIAHDGTLNGGTVYTFKVTIRTITAGTGTCTSVAFNCVQIQLYRGGTLVASWTDKNNAWNNGKTGTIQDDCDAGYFTTVTGYQSAWCLPIYATGQSGFRNDEVNQVWIDDFSMTEAGNGGDGEVTPSTSATSSVTIKGGTFRNKGGTVIFR